MDENTKGNYAFIDGQNLHSGVKKSGWKLDHKKFRQFLLEEFNVTRAYIFIGYMEEQQDLYNVLQEAGFVLFFKPLLRYEDGSVKGNVDAELIVQALVEKDRYDQAVIVSGDGDFVSMLRHLNTENKLKGIIIPNKFTYSSLFKRLEGFDKDLVTYIGDFKSRLAYGHFSKPKPYHSKPPRNNTNKQPNKQKFTKPRNDKPAPKPKAVKAPTKNVKPTAVEQTNRIKSKAQVEGDLLATIAAQASDEPVKKKPAPKKAVAKKPVAKKAPAKTVKKPAKKPVKKS